MKKFLQGIQYLIVAICIILMISCEIGPISRLFYLCLTIAMITNLFSSNKYIKWGGMILGLVCIFILIRYY